MFHDPTGGQGHVGSRGALVHHEIGIAIAIGQCSYRDA